MFWPTKKELLSPPNADGEKCMHYPEDGTTSARERATRSGLEAQNSASTVQDAVDYRVGSIGGETGPLPRRRFSAQSAAATLGPHDAIWYPEGGQTAYFCAFGSFCGCMMSLGLMNSFGAFQAYLSRNQLAHVGEPAIGWIFGLFAFVTFVGGMQVGPIFDARGPRLLVLLGSLLILLSVFLLEFCTAYWQFMLDFSILGGLGTSLVFTPSVTAVGHFFLLKRGQWMGFVCVGGSLGGVMYPLVLQALFQRAGFAWGTRTLGLMILVLALFANLFIRSRLPPKELTKENILPSFRVLADPALTLTTLGAFLVEWGILNPVAYLPSYGIEAGLGDQFSYRLVAILNAASCLGRYIPGQVADKMGRFNAIILAGGMRVISLFAFWLTTGANKALCIVFAISFGFFSGSGISLVPVCVGQLCKTGEYGQYYATSYTFVSIAALTGIPISGALISAVGGKFWALIVFTGCAYVASTSAFLAARVYATGWKAGTKF